MDNKKEGNIKSVKKEDTTKYGEFVCSAHHWLPIEEQKDRADKLANITNIKKHNKNNMKF